MTLQMRDLETIERGREAGRAEGLRQGMEKAEQAMSSHQL